jgi:hypothetical protein
MTRREKIARLPLNIRESLNSRLENATPRAIPVLCLNTLPPFPSLPVNHKRSTTW